MIFWVVPLAILFGVLGDWFTPKLSYYLKKLNRHYRRHRARIWKWDRQIALRSKTSRR